MIQAPDRRFYHRLAALLGMTVNELLGKLSQQELIDWMAFFRIEPWGCRVEDRRFGVIGALIANMFSSGGRRYSSDDIFPAYSEGERQQKIMEDIDRVMMNLSLKGSSNG